ncbi:hypothetical protein D3C72_1671290 [compost metagenome]
MDADVSGTPDCRPAPARAYLQMASGGCYGERPEGGCDEGYPPRRGDLAVAGEYLPSLRAGSVGEAVAPPACPWRYGCCALRGRQRGGFQEAIAGSAVPGAVAGTPGQVWPIPQCGENTAD